ncbi:MAG: tail fiber domain-containing protein [bacterium]|nr:tail fiber domain-containing protein [bacterium]
MVASNGTFIHTNSTATLGAQLPANSTAWEAICDSTKKERYGQVNTRDVLSKLTMIPIETWSYKDDPNHIKHIGPMAQDFYAAFHVGESDTTISTLDPDGVALAAIQELAKQNEQKDTKITELEARVKQLEAAILQFGNLTQTDKQ